MSYCRFRNTLYDLKDCWENWDDPDLSEDEAGARKELLSLCQQVVEVCEEEDYDDGEA